MMQRKPIVLVILGISVVLALAGLGEMQAGGKTVIIPVELIIPNSYIDPTTGIAKNAMLRNDGKDTYTNGSEGVSAYLAYNPSMGVLGDLAIDILSKSERRVLLDFVNPEGCGCGNPAPPLGTVNYFGLTTRSMGRYPEPKLDFLSMVPGSVLGSNAYLQIKTPGPQSYLLEYGQGCDSPDMWGILVVFAGRDADGDGYSDEWDVYPSQESLDKALLWIIALRKAPACNIGIFEMPFKISIKRLDRAW